MAKKLINIHCDSCEAVAINNVACHEQGCPDSWREPFGDHLPYMRSCHECGDDFRPDNKHQKLCNDCISSIYGEEE